MVGEQLAQRLDVAGDLVGQLRRELAELEQLHVEVAGRAGDRLQLLEAVAKRAQRLGREHAAQLALQGARAPHRDAQVVEELGVGVGERAGRVELDDLEQAPQDDDRGLVRAGVRIQRDAQLRRDPADDPADRRDRVVLHGARRRHEPHRAAQQLGQLAQLAVIAEHADDVQARRERDPRPIACERDRLLDAQAHDDLAEVVEDVHRQLAAAHAHDRRERAHLEQRLEALAQRAGGEIAREQPRGAALEAVRRLLGSGRGIDQREPAAGLGERQAGAAHAAVERVPERALDDVRLARDDRDLAGQRVGHRRRRKTLREQQLQGFGGHRYSLSTIRARMRVAGLYPG